MRSSTRTAPAIRIRLACTYCHDALAVGDGEFCAGCLAPHHPDCFREHGECSAPGCGARRVVGAPRPSPPASISRRRHAFGPLCVLGAIGVSALAVPAVLWRRQAMADRRAEALEARLGEARAENARLELALAEARAADASRIAPLDDAGGRGRIPIQWRGPSLVAGMLRPEVEATLPGGAR